MEKEAHMGSIVMAYIIMEAEAGPRGLLSIQQPGFEAHSMAFGHTFQREA
jgi:hypothetical protein